MAHVEIDGEQRPQLLGSGLPRWAYVAVLGASVALFLVWNGLLWNAPPGASHVTRFAVSYLAVPALAAAALLALRGFSWTKLGTATGTIWAIKLLVTAVLYLAIAGGTATHLEPAAVPASAVGPRAPAGAASAAYVAATGSFAAGSVRGTVRIGAVPLVGAAVYLDAPRPGSPTRAPRAAELVLREGRYLSPLVVALAADSLAVVSFDDALHTVHLRAGGRKLGNQPLRRAPAPGASARTALSMPAPGVYDVGCDAHADEGTRLLVVDHPYVAITEAGGAFALDGVPAGDATLVVVAPAGAPAIAARRTVHVEPGKTVDVVVVDAETNLTTTEMTAR